MFHFGTRLDIRGNRKAVLGTVSSSKGGSEMFHLTHFSFIITMLFLGKSVWGKSVWGKSVWGV